MAEDVDKKDDQPQAAKTKLNTIVSHLDVMKTLITSLQQEMDAGDFSARARRACNHGGNGSFVSFHLQFHLTIANMTQLHILIGS
jgi:hypothetical protein